MNLLQSLLYGLFSGLAEFIPVSSRGHQAILLYLFGIDGRDPVQELIIHLSSLAALCVCCRSLIAKFTQESRMIKRYRKKRRSRNSAIRTNYDLRLIQTAMIPMIAGLLFTNSFAKIESTPIYVGISFAVNGIILCISEYIRHGNKNAKHMTGFDSILIGLGGALSAIPGISRIGAASSAAVIRGADKEHAVNWVLLLSIPALAVLLVLDVIACFVTPLASVGLIWIIGYLLTAFSTFAGSFLGILLIRFLTARAFFSGFAYYSWGVTMFTFILYLIV